MDLQDWELLPQQGYLEINYDRRGKKIYSRKYPTSASGSVCQMNYFICPEFADTKTLKIDEDDEAAEVKIQSFDEQDPVSQVFFKKMMETEFADMKVESPKSSREILPPQIEAFHQFEEGDPGDNSSDQSGLNIWKWSLTAICSVATVCIIVLSNKHHHQKLQLQIYTSDKRMKQVVEQANKMNGVPFSRAQITFGGYYDAPV